MCARALIHLPNVAVLVAVLVAVVVVVVVMQWYRVHPMFIKFVSAA